MLTEEDKIEFDRQSKQIDILTDGKLSPFQISFMKDILYWYLKSGEYIYLEHYVTEKNKEIDTPDNIIKEIKFLIDNHYITKKS